jgi:hypothetical protein
MPPILKGGGLPGLLCTLVFSGCRQVSTRQTKEAGRIYETKCKTLLKGSVSQDFSIGLFFGINFFLSQKTSLETLPYYVKYLWKYVHS